MKHSKLIALFVFVVFAIAFFAIDTAPLAADSPLQWSVVRRIPGIEDVADPPFLIADQNRTVHAFTSQMVSEKLAVFYNQWTLEGGWTKPVDILLSPNKDRAIVLGAFLDSKGMLHVIFYGGDEKKAEIYYSQAPAANAAQATAWTPPMMIGTHAGSPPSGVLVGDAKGNLFVIFGGNKEGNGIYETHSTDGGETWSKSASIFSTGKKTLFTGWPQLRLDDQGWLHAIWTVLTTGGQGRGIYYSRMNFRTGQWSLPVALATSPSGLGVLDSSLVVHKGRLFAAFYNGNHVMRMSNDGGQTWTEKIAPFPRHIGRNGQGVFVVDGNGDLHFFWGQRITGSPDIHGLWHSVYQEDQWSEPKPIVSGPATDVFDPSNPQATISQGNELLVTWRQDPGLEGNGVWYSYTRVNAPELPVVPLPTPKASNTRIPDAVPTMAVVEPSPTAPQRPTVAIPTPRAGLDTPETTTERDPNLNILLAVIPVVLLVVIVVVRNLK